MSTTGFVWKKHGRKKLAGYCPSLDLEVTIERVSNKWQPGYTITARIANTPLDLGEKFPQFAKALTGKHEGYPSAWSFFMRAFDGFSKQLFVARQAASVEAA